MTGWDTVKIILDQRYLLLSIIEFYASKTDIRYYSLPNSLLKKWQNWDFTKNVSFVLCVYIYIYIYIYENGSKSDGM